MTACHGAAPCVWHSPCRLVISDIIWHHRCTSATSQSDGEVAASTQQLHFCLNFISELTYASFTLNQLGIYRNVVLLFELSVRSTLI